MWQDSPESNGGADERVEFFVSTDSELQVAGSNALHFEILRGVLLSRRLAKKSGRQVWSDDSLLQARELQR